MKRRITFLVFCLTLAASSVALMMATWGSTPCPVDVRPETFDKLKCGMSEKEVEAILGGPAGNYTTRPDVDYEFGPVSFSGYMKDSQLILVRNPGIERKWLTDQYAIHVTFDDRGKTIRIAGGRADPPPPSTRYPPPLRPIMHLILDP